MAPKITLLKGTAVVKKSTFGSNGYLSDQNGVKETHRGTNHKANAANSKFPSNEFELRPLCYPTFRNITRSGYQNRPPVIPSDQGRCDYQSVDNFSRWLIIFNEHTKGVPAFCTADSYRHRFTDHIAMAFRGMWKKNDFFFMSVQRSIR